MMEAKPSDPLPKTKRRRPVVGDVLRMIAFPGENVVAHYVLDSKELGPFVKVLRGLYSERVDSLEGYAPLFGPISGGILPPVRSGEWTVVGKVAPEAFRLPRFLMCAGGRPPHEPPVWWLYENGRQHRFGSDVPTELRSLEILQVWSAALIEERVQTGTNDWSYAATMRNFQPLP